MKSFIVTSESTEHSRISKMEDLYPAPRSSALPVGAVVGLAYIRRHRNSEAKALYVLTLGILHKEKKDKINPQCHCALLIHDWLFDFKASAASTVLLIFA